MFSPSAFALTKGAVGGDKGCAAAAAIFRFAVETASELPEGDKMKRRNPTDRTPARMIVIGFVRRILIGSAIVDGFEG